MATPTKATPIKGKSPMARSVSNDNTDEDLGFSAAPSKTTPSKGKSPMKRNRDDTGDEGTPSAKKSKVKIILLFG